MLAFQSSVMVGRSLHQKSFPLLPSDYPSTLRGPCSRGRVQALLREFPERICGHLSGEVIKVFRHSHCGKETESLCFKVHLFTLLPLQSWGPLISYSLNLKKKNLFKWWRIYDSSFPLLQDKSPWFL